MNSQNNKINISKKDLINLYWKEDFSTTKIANLYNCNPETIRRWMIKYKIKRREKHSKKYNISKNELKESYNKKLSTTEIAKKYNCSQWVIWSLLHKYGIKSRKSYDYHSWKPPKNQIIPDLKINQTHAYIIGVILGDGWIYSQKNKHTYFIGLEAKDKPFCEEFKKALIKVKLNPSLFKTKKAWKVLASSKLFYEWFNSLSYKEIGNIVNTYTKEFLKGFYESDGSLAIHKPKKYNYITIRIIIVNTNKKNIDLTMKALNKLNYYHTCHKRKTKPPRKPLWVITISNKNQSLRFLNEIKPCIKNNIKA